MAVGSMTWPAMVEVSLPSADGLALHPRAFGVVYREILGEYEPILQRKRGSGTFYFHLTVPASTRGDALGIVDDLADKLMTRFHARETYVEVEAQPFEHQAVSPSTQLQSLPTVETHDPKGDDAAEFELPPES